MAQEASTLVRLMKRFNRSKCCWMSTVRPDGRAHSVPVWHVWFSGAVYVAVRSASVKARNLRLNASVVLSHPDPHDVVILEGTARAADELRRQIAPLFVQKYDWDLADSPDYDLVLRIRPHKLMAWGEEGTHRFGTPDFESLEGSEI